MTPYTVLLDANILYSESIRDVCLELSLAGNFLGKWTEHIHEEWINARVENEGHDRANLEQTRVTIDETAEDCLITGYEDLIPKLNLPDRNDRHVLAAAIFGRCDAIVTMNLDDFPARELAPYGIEARHPDEFLVGQINLDPIAFFDAIKEIRSRLVKPSYSVEEYLSNLKKQGLVGTVTKLERHSNLL